MEPITTALIAKLMYDNIKNIGISIFEHAKDKYLPQVIDAVGSQIGIDPASLQEIIPEVLECRELGSATKFEEFCKTNSKIDSIISNINANQKSISIKVEKGIGYIEENHGSITF